MMANTTDNLAKRHITFAWINRLGITIAGMFLKTTRGAK